MIETSPLITIVIPVKNRFRELSATLAAACKQSLPVEIIIIDDNSDEKGLDAVVRQYSNIVPIRLEKNTKKGVCSARNQGLMLARTKYVAFLDADDIWQPNFLVQMLAHLEKYPDSIGAMALSTPLIENGFPLLLRMKIRIVNWAKRCLLRLMHLLSGQLSPDAPFLGQLSHMLFVRENLPLFDENLFMAEEWIFVYEVLKKGRISIKPEILLYFKYSLKSTTFSTKHNSVASKQNIYFDLIKSISQDHPNSIFLKFFVFYTKYFLIIF